MNVIEAVFANSFAEGTSQWTVPYSVRFTVTSKYLGPLLFLSQAPYSYAALTVLELMAVLLLLRPECCPCVHHIYYFSIRREFG